MILLPSQECASTASPGICDATSRRPLLTVIIPVYNEAATLDVLLHRVAEVPIAKQVIVINDGSTDGSAAVLRKWALNESVLVLTHTINQGKGNAIRNALRWAVGEYTIVQDGDLEYDPQDYLQLIRVLQSKAADVVLGSRYLKATDIPVGSLFRFGVYMLNRITKILYRVVLTDEATCYKAACTSVFRRMNLQCERFEFCPEFIAKACRMGLRIQEVPISYHPRNAKAGKKIRLRDGWVAARTLWRWRKWSEESVRTDPIPIAEC